MKIIQGRRYRIVETYPTGTVLTYEGVVTHGVDTDNPGETVEFRAAGTAWVNDHQDVKVTVEELRDPLPTAHGSLIRYYVAGREHEEISVLQMRVPTERKTVHDQGQPVEWANFNWVNSNNLLVTDPIGDFDVIFDAGAEA